MAYIGTKPTVGNFQICDAISVVNGQAAYTMQVGSVNVIPQSANHMICSLNGTIQKPNSSYTVSGSTITFASNLVTGDVIDFIQILGDVLDLGVPSDATVTTAKLADSSVSLAKLTATGTKSSSTFLRGDNTFDTPPLGGITGADIWRITTNFSGDADPITSFWERADDATSGIIGSGMTQSSGIFTFPSTGIWRVAFNHSFYYNGDDRDVTNYIQVSSDSGSNYDTVATASGFIQQTNSNNTHNGVICYAYVDVTNASTFKVYFRVSKVNSNTNTVGSTTVNKTFVEFLRLGDT